MPCKASGGRECSLHPPEECEWAMSAVAGGCSGGAREAAQGRRRKGGGAREAAAFDGAWKGGSRGWWNQGDWGRKDLRRRRVVL